GPGATEVAEGVETRRIEARAGAHALGSEDARRGMRLGDARLEMDRRGEHPLDETDGGVHGADARRSSGGTQARARKTGDARRASGTSGPRVDPARPRRPSG